jgi:hypothetical protein
MSRYIVSVSLNREIGGLEVSSHASRDAANRAARRAVRAHAGDIPHTIEVLTTRSGLHEVIATLAPDAQGRSGTIFAEVTYGRSEIAGIGSDRR